MNYYAAREIADKDGKGTGRYRYTVENKRTGIYAIGYCADNCDGHDTREGAQEHYKQYLLDHRLDLDSRMSGMQQECLVCGAWTQRMAVVHDHGHYVLCDAHCTRDEVEQRLTIGEAWGTL